MPRILDLFCGAGGAGMGYYLAGFEVIGVDSNPQPRYPFEFHQADAMTYPLEGFDAIHASPPCQRYSTAQRIRGLEHPDLIAPTRDALRNIGLPYVIENVVGAPLESPTLLCGSMFGLGTYRHRLFETSFWVTQPAHQEHAVRTTKMGRAVKNGEMMHVVGNFSGVEKAREAMGIPWMTRNELRESIPPAYTKWIGEHLRAAVEAKQTA